MNIISMHENINGTHIYEFQKILPANEFMRVEFIVNSS